MAKSSKDRNVKNLHIEVDDDFHKRLKLICVMKGVTLKDYALSALRAQVEDDEGAE